MRPSIALGHLCAFRIAFPGGRLRSIYSQFASDQHCHLVGCAFSFGFSAYGTIQAADSTLSPSLNIQTNAKYAVRQNRARISNAPTMVLLTWFALLQIS